MRLENGKAAPSFDTTDLAIHLAYYGQDIGDHPPLGNIRLWLQKAATGKDDPADDA